MNDSTTGGPIVPVSSGPAPLEGKALLDFLQAWIVGMSGLAGNYVRATWQAEPPVIPPDGTAWISLKVKRGKIDTYPWQGFQRNPVTPPAPLPASPPFLFVRNEELHLTCRTYDLGVDGQADVITAQLRDGASVGQNREYLQLAGFGIGYVGESEVVPTLFKQRWQYRVDLPICVRRRVDRVYPVAALLEGQGTVYTDRGTTILTTPWNSGDHRP